MYDAHSKRVFFALWPDDSVRGSISSVSKKSIYGSTTGLVHRATNLHLTLHFLGNLTPQQINCALQQAEKVKAEKFELVLDTFGSFEKAKILWVGPSEIPVQLAELHKKLAESLTICHLSVESRSYQPHVTLIRKFKDFKASEVSQKVLWKVDRFALVESVSTTNGVEYRPLQIFALGNCG